MTRCNWFWHSHGCSLDSDHEGDHYCGEEYEGTVYCGARMRVLSNKRNKKDKTYPALFITDTREFVTTAFRLDVA